MYIPSIGVGDELAMVVVDDGLVAAGSGVGEGWEGRCKRREGAHVVVLRLVVMLNM